MHVADGGGNVYLLRLLTLTSVQTLTRLLHPFLQNSDTKTSNSLHVHVEQFPTSVVSQKRGWEFPKRSADSQELVQCSRCWCQVDVIPLWWMCTTGRTNKGKDKLCEDKDVHKHTFWNSWINDSQDKHLQETFDCIKKMHLKRRFRYNKCATLTTEAISERMQKCHVPHTKAETHR